METAGKNKGLRRRDRKCQEIEGEGQRGRNNIWSVGLWLEFGLSDNNTRTCRNTQIHKVQAVPYFVALKLSDLLLCCSR